MVKVRCILRTNIFGGCVTSKMGVENANISQPSPAFVYRIWQERELYKACHGAQAMRG
jgi:hypothetical protein